MATLNSTAAAGLQVDALYFRVSSNRQTTENQFEDLLSVAEQDASERDWHAIRLLLAQAVYTEEKAGQRGTRLVYHVRPEIVAQLAKLGVYVEQGKSGKAGSRRPLFEQMKRDAALRKFSRLLVWKVSRLGRDMREVLATAYELTDAGITVVPVKSQTGPLTSSLGKLLWAVQSWFAEFENDERSQTIKAGLQKARACGKRLGRQRANVDLALLTARRLEGASWRQLAAEFHLDAATLLRTSRRCEIPAETAVANA